MFCLLTTGDQGFSYKSATTDYLQGVPYTRPNTLYRLGSQAEIGAMYPYFAQQMIDDGLKSSSQGSKRRTEAEGISFSRSAWLGSQRFSSALWNGDVDGSWEAFPIQIVTGLNAQVCNLCPCNLFGCHNPLILGLLQMSGMLWWASDIGGYYATKSYHGNISDPTYRELYVRWFQYGTYVSPRYSIRLGYCRRPGRC